MSLLLNRLNVEKVKVRFQDIRGGPRAWRAVGITGFCKARTGVWARVRMWITTGSASAGGAVAVISVNAQSGQNWTGPSGTPERSSVTVFGPCPVHSTACPAACAITPRASAICCDVTAISSATVSVRMWVRRVMPTGYQAARAAERAEKVAGTGSPRRPRKGRKQKAQAQRPGLWKCRCARSQAAGATAFAMSFLTFSAAADSSASLDFAKKASSPPR